MSLVALCALAVRWASLERLQIPGLTARQEGIEARLASSTVISKPRTINQDKLQIRADGFSDHVLILIDLIWTSYPNQSAESETWHSEMSTVPPYSC